MDNKERVPSWRKVVIIICSLLMVVCVIIIGNLHKIIHYNYNYIEEWDSKNISHIGNISKIDSRGYKLDANWVNIGNRYWYSNDFEDVESDKELGKLIRLYSYSISDSGDPHYGETVSLWIYDISDRMINLRMTKDSFYKYIHDKCSSDTTSIWKSTDEFKPFIALYTRPSLIFFTDSVKAPMYKENFIIFANNRIYCFNFNNDKYFQKGMDGLNAFHRRCKSVIDDTDFISYAKWEKDYDEYKTLKERQDNEREQWGQILYGILFICSICIFVLVLRSIGKENKEARLLSFYVITCLAIGLIIMAIRAFDSPCKDETLAWLVLAFFPSFIIYMLMISFLSQKSKEKYNTFYLIPEKAIKYLNINTEFKKRLALLFVFYPLFIIVPIPVWGLMAFVFYILPVVVIILLYQCIKKIILWLNEGKKSDITPTDYQTDKARLYCRHCGKLIDADSDYCRYCGKKLQ